MDWQTLLSVAGLVLFIMLMMRGGDMGCCGTGHHDNKRKNEGTPPAEDRR
jgi:hypothetical protein